MDEEQRISVWFSGIFLSYVFPDALEYIFSICGNSGFKTDGYSAVDLSGTVALGVSRNDFTGRGGAVCLWILQYYADIYTDRSGCHDLF